MIESLPGRQCIQTVNLVKTALMFAHVLRQKSDEECVFLLLFAYPAEVTEMFTQQVTHDVK